MNRFIKLLNVKGSFIYPGISKGYWGITDKYTNENLPIMFATVTFNKYPTQHYIAILSNRDQPVTKKLESTMAICHSIYSIVRELR